MNKKELIIIDNEIISTNDFLVGVGKYRYALKEKQIQTINICLEQSIYFLEVLWASLFEGININFTLQSDKSTFLEADLSFINSKITQNSLVFDKLEDVYLSFNNEKISYLELNNIFYGLTKKNIFKNSDTFYIATEFNSLHKIYLSFIFPIFINSRLIFSEDTSNIFLKYKPTVYFANRKNIKKLHKLMLFSINNRKILEIFYTLFKDWDNELISAYMNKFIFFYKYKSLKIILIENIIDLKGLWIDFESIGITIYSEKSIQNNK